MTVIVAYKDKSGKPVLVADRVWYGYGHDRVLGRKIFGYSDCVAGFAGDHRTVEMVNAKTFAELSLALEKQHDTDALIIKGGDIYHYLTSDGKPDFVKLHGYDCHRTIGSYHNPVNYAISVGHAPEDAVRLIHLLWNLDEPVDVADEGWLNLDVKQVTLKE